MQATGETIKCAATNCVLSAFNARQSAPLDDLIPLIASKGVLQNLIGFEQIKAKKKTGIIEIVAGGRRIRSVHHLIENGTFDADYQVDVKIVPVEEAVAISLMENSGRLAMHPADECAAYKTLVIDQNMAMEDVAAMYGVGVPTIKRRLKLANVAPSLMQEFRDSKITLDQITALALADDEETQMRVWKSLPVYQRTPYYIKNAITQNEVGTDDRRVKYVTLAAYEKAGGSVRRDLFAEKETGYVQDIPLLDKLVADKLARKAAKVKADSGLAWVEILASDDYRERNRFAQVGKKQLPLTKKEAEKCAAYDAEIATIDQKMATLDEGDDEYETLSERRDELDIKIDDIHAKKFVLDPEQQALAGALIYLDYNGQADVTLNVLKPEDKAQFVTKAAANGDTSAIAQKQKAIHSERLSRQLTAHRTAAIGASLIEQSHVALAYLAHKLSTSVFGMWSSFDNVAKVSITECDLVGNAVDMEPSRAHKTITDKEAYWRALMPDDSELLLEWLIAQTDATLVELLAYCTAVSINTIQHFAENTTGILAVSKAVALDMADYWTPTKESYFAHVSKPVILDVVSSVATPEQVESLAKMKKGDLCDAAEGLMQGHRWLPDALKATAVVAAQTTNEEDSESASELEEIEG